MTWIVMIAIGLGSFGFRVGPLLLFEGVSLSPRLDRAIRHGGIAAISALVVISAKGATAGGKTIPTLVAVVPAIALAARGASLIRTLIFGSALYAGALVVMSLAGH